LPSLNPSIASAFSAGVVSALEEDTMKSKYLAIPLSLLCASALTVAGVFVVSTIASGAHSAERPRAQNQLIPLYDNANPADWTQACSQVGGSGSGSSIIADAAPDAGGPGGAAEPAWASVIKKCSNYGRAAVIGYVWTDYGKGGQASIASIESQIDAWYSYYPGEIAGIFFDGVSDDPPGTSTSNETFYRALAAYVHSHEGSNEEVVFNFGKNPGSDWTLTGSGTENANIVVTFEGSYDTPGENPYTSWTQAPWELGYPAHDFAALIHDAPYGTNAPQPASACSSLARQNIGYVYVGTTYDRLPTYFKDLATKSISGSC
jgi:Spherulation-specific family 4